ncbi:HK97 family phage prohead protease [Endozoicomonas acroporae]|uniref:HK97 family phage prohead protease n=1 Tax=Endozoicomonas acroporae TaxID=1701104 RepID=UPI0013D17C03|nr:HK97 family phage prohead protease [Endozoicomonas acroporae]
MKIKKLRKPFEVKSLGDDGTFSGYASVFDVVDSYGDVVKKGAFLESLGEWSSKGKLPPILWQHDPDQPIGPYTMMVEDEKGLYVEGKLLIDDDPLAKRAYAHLKAGTISGLSIGYTIPSGGGHWDEKAGVYRLEKLKLYEVSLVTFPANESAEVESVKSAIGNPKEFERFLRDAGLSRMQAKRLMSGGFSALSGPEREDGAEAVEALKSLASIFTPQ